MFAQLKNEVRRSKTERKGFTLIELLVVIAIIALLLSILMPALGKAKKQAQSVVCRSNLKQIGMGVLLYANNNKDDIVPYYTRDTLPTGVISTAWYRRLVADSKLHPFNATEYIAGYDTLFCPTHKLMPPRPDNNPNKISETKAYAVDRGEISYGLSSALFADYWTPGLPPFSPAKIALIRQPSATIAATDAMHRDDSKGLILGSWFIRPYYQELGWDVASIRHDAACNTLWMDAHVTTVRAPDPENERTIYNQEALTNYGMNHNYWDRK